jgi:hypothetical protein
MIAFLGLFAFFVCPFDVVLASESACNRATTTFRSDSVPYVVPDGVANDEKEIATAIVPLVWLVGRDAVDRQRLGELTGKPSVQLLLRSPSRLLGASRTRRGLLALTPEVQIVSNSALPFSVNDGAVWAGRGVNTRIAGGFFARYGSLRVMFAPEIITAANRDFDLHIPQIERPPIPPDRSPWSFEWYAYGPYSIDMPTRFGDRSIRRIEPGQSSLAVGGRVEAGVSTESNWWGPGVNNALILSDNAAGFPHLFFRSSHPLGTKVGELDFRWIVGGLAESDYFDTLSTNDLRSISAGAVTLRLRRPFGLTIGAARSVWGTATGWGEIPLRWLEVFHPTRRRGGAALSDSALYPGGREQIASLFAHWIFPRAGFETYAEWGRTHLPTSIRDFLVTPNHSQAYTLGLQWRRPGFRGDQFWRIHAENTSVEQSATFRNRPLGVWYTSRHVIQGYTHRGQLLGAAVGPGSSGQTLALDYFGRRGSIGLQAGRMRLNEDVRSISPILDFKRWCTHDINLYWGARASTYSALGFASIDVRLGNRIQPWFQVRSGCPRGDAMVDIRNNTVSIILAPFRRP